MKELTRADTISLMVLERDLYKGDWLHMLPPRYTKAIHGIAPYLVFRCLMDATAQNISPDMAYFEKYLEESGVKRQTVSKHLSLFIKDGIVEKSSWDRDKRNSIYTFTDSALKDFTPVLMQGIINNVDAFTLYTSANGDMTPRVLQILAERDATAEMLETSLFENYGVPSNVYAMMRRNHIARLMEKKNNKNGTK